MPIIVVPDDKPSVLKGTVEEQRLRKLGEVRIHESRALGDEELLSRVTDADIVYNIRATSVFSHNVMKRCPRLKLIAVFGVGYDNVDVQAASELGITVTNTPGYSAVTVGEMSLSLMLAVARKIVQNDHNIRAGGWARGYSSQLYGKTLGVIGTGNIGLRMIHLGKAIGMNVIAWTLHPSPERAAEYGVEFVTLEELMRQSDVASIHVPGVPQTNRLLGKRELGLMKPTALVLAVLGSIYMGIATITESAAIGAVGGFICACVYRRISWRVLKETCYQTLRLSSFICFILIGGLTFAAIYAYVGAPDFIESLLLGMPGGRWGILILMQFTFLVMGCFLDEVSIIMLTVPAFMPVVRALDFDPLWFGVLFIVNMQVAYLTPPFGFNLFYLKGVAPKELTMLDVYKSVWPFVILQLIGLALVMIFPQIILWFPELMIGIRG